MASGGGKEVEGEGSEGGRVIREAMERRGEGEEEKTIERDKGERNVIGTEKSKM